MSLKLASGNSGRIITDWIYKFAEKHAGEIKIPSKLATDQRAGFLLDTCLVENYTFSAILNIPNYHIPFR